MAVVGDHYVLVNASVQFEFLLAGPGSGTLWVWFGSPLSWSEYTESTNESAGWEATDQSQSSIKINRYL